MALRSDSKKRSFGIPGKGSKAQTPSRQSKGSVRRTQMITTYGVGSLVALGDQSFLVSGLDTWRVNWAPVIYEPNLQRWLGVTHFRLPPADNPPSGDGVKIRRFPQWYSCSKCKDLKPYKDFGGGDKNTCQACGTTLTPSRFIVACVNGHLDDFPYWEWVHRKKGASGAERTSSCKLSLHTTGSSASLASIIIKCSCGEQSSMAGSFGKEALRSIGVTCRCRRPWLGRGADETSCGEAPRTLQRGSSAAWFPVHRSSLSIPPWSQRLQQLLNKHMNQITKHRDDERSLRVVIETFIDGTEFTVEQVLSALEARDKLAEESLDDDAKLDASSRLRAKEYKELEAGVSAEHLEDEFECEPAPLDPSAPRPAELDKVMLVKRLREVRALRAFTRVEAPDRLTLREREAKLSLEKLDWLPAIEVSGEGVFLSLDNASLRTWEQSPGPLHRADRIRGRHEVLLRERAERAGVRATKADLTSEVDARFILLHTLAHALINEWSLDSGYPAASLRERIYSSDTMKGILIYTAASDSAGSLGGLVAQGDAKRLRASLTSAMDRVSWCSQDPPCMESEASGTDSLNLAACYACVLLPETSCETNNAFLDRASLIGTPESPEIGYFTGLRTS
ncbi:DUF1998 domain-containing protein [Actinomadura macrotermitis]|uniref:MrfA-like Zn-binding domain-containing protein n=1 Tax=Actinomadura macrotermitis TaxID=2585200 RepID=A0A7K0BTU1_9ACTN|nr:DUF1998 domain-containing protein [Actinomadura macrotermitis]MQY04605.1 hypothetical protein [Actinomadura macrotermitis]